MTLVSADKGRVVARQREREGGLKRAILTLNTLNREAGGGAWCVMQYVHSYTALSTQLHTSAETQPPEYHTIEMMMMMFGIVRGIRLGQEGRGVESQRVFSRAELELTSASSWATMKIEKK